MAQDPYAIVSRPTRPGAPAAPKAPSADPFAIVTRPRAPGPATMAEQLAAKQAEELKKRQQAALREWHEDKPKYFKKLVYNAPADIGRQLMGVVGLGGTVVGATAELGSDLGNWTRDVVGLEPYYLKDKPNQKALEETIKALPDELIAHYAGYLDPEGLALKIQEGPVTTALDVIPAAGAVKGAAKAGTAAARAAARVVTSPGIAGRIAKGAVTHVPGVGPFLRNAIDIVEALKAEGGGATPPAPRPPRPTPMPGITTRQPAAPPVQDFGVPPMAAAGESVASDSWMSPGDIQLAKFSPAAALQAVEQVVQAERLPLFAEQRALAARLVVEEGADPRMAAYAVLQDAPETLPPRPAPGAEPGLLAPEALVGPAPATAAPAAAPREAQAPPAVVPGAPGATPGPPAEPVTAATAAVDTLDTPWAGRTRGQQSPAWLQNDLGLAARRAGLQLAPEQLAEAARLVVEDGLTPNQAVRTLGPGGTPPAGGGGTPAPGAGAVDMLLGPQVAGPRSRAAPAAVAETPVAAAPTAGPMLVKPRLTLDENRLAAQLQAAGKTPAEIRATLDAMRALSPMTPSAMRAEIAARAGNASPSREAGTIRPGEIRGTAEGPVVAPAAAPGLDAGAGGGRGVTVSTPAQGLGAGTESLRPTPTPEVHALASRYATSRGLPPVKHETYATVDKPRAHDIANAYDAMPVDDSANPATISAYADLRKEIDAQWEHATADGVHFEPWTKEGQPYASSKEMVADVQKNKHLYFFTGGEPHPLLGEIDPATGLTYNDKFRAVHDYFGHAAGGYGFGARGEENAWISHSQMMPFNARRAMTTETRGQNSWVNFGKQNYHPDGTAKNLPAIEKPYATQKVALLPDEYVRLPGETATPAAAGKGAALAETLHTPWAQRTKGQQSPAWLESDLGLAARRAGVTLAVAQRAAARELVRTGGLTPVEAVQKVAANEPEDRRPVPDGGLGSGRLFPEAGAPPQASANEPRPRSVIRAATMTERMQDKVRDLYGAVGTSQLGKLADALGVSDFEGIERAYSDPEPPVAMGMQGPPGLRRAAKALKAVEKAERAAVAWAKKRGKLSGQERLAFDRAYAVKHAALNGRPMGSLARTLKPGASDGIYTLRDEAVDRLRDIYSIGTEMTSTSNWAGAASDDLVRAFGGDRDMALKWARMWGATSPNTSVPVNTKESISALVHALENPKTPFTIELAQSMPQGKITMAPSKVPNLNNALEGRPLSGDKVEAMAAFMAGHPRIPIDVHALYALGSDATKLGPELKALRKFMAQAEDVPVRGSFTKTDLYVRYEDALRRTLQSFDPDRSINQIFAELWEGARFHKGLKHQGGPLDVLRRKGLLEYGAMLDPERLRAVLKTQGWTLKGISGFFAAIGLGAGAMAEGEGGAGATGAKP